MATVFETLGEQLFTAFFESDETKRRTAVAAWQECVGPVGHNLRSLTAAGKSMPVQATSTGPTVPWVTKHRRSSRLRSRNLRS